MKIKKSFSMVLAVLMFALMLVGCARIPVPAVKEGRFNFSVTYVADGEEETVSSVFVCRFVKVVRALDGGYREWDRYIEDSALSDRLASTRGYLLLKTVDDGEIFLDLNLSAKYFMADPNYWAGDGVDTSEIRPRLFIEYTSEKYEEIGESYSDDAVVLEGYGVKLISFEYDEPIENSYK